MNMKTILYFSICFFVSPLFSQKKITEDELKSYEWIVFNKSVEDSSEMLNSDTLLLVKSHDLETYEEVLSDESEKINEQFSRHWHMDFVSAGIDTTGQSNEFNFFYVDLRKAAMKRKMEVDSLTYFLLLQDPNATDRSAIPADAILSNLQNGDVIQIINTKQNQLYYIEKKSNQLIVLKTLKSRFIYYPKGINSGIWTLSKKTQQITFTDNQGTNHFTYKIERINAISLRLVRI